VSRPISLIDTTPTILDLIGSSLPSEFQGSSVLRPDVKMPLFSTDYSLSLMGLRDGCWKYIYEMDSGRSKLFNLCEDPMESTDVSSTKGDRVAAYRQRVLGWSIAQKALMKGSR
jgi:arylsulfatase A-like enzyme